MKAKTKLQTDTREAVFLAIIGELWKYNDEGIRAVADDASVHWVTLYHWKSGKTYAPRICTLARVALVLGFELRLVKVAKTARLRAVK